MSDFRFVDLFAGIGGMRIPFERLGGKCVCSSEWDDHAQQTYYYNFLEMPTGDITKIDAGDISDHDILLAGFPCQPFSIIGDKQGFADTLGYGWTSIGVTHFSRERRSAFPTKQNWCIKSYRRCPIHWALGVGFRRSTA